MTKDRQVRLLRQKLMEGKTQETAAAMAGMCVRSARKWQDGLLPSETKEERWWRTRPDPFDGVWEEEIEPLLRDDLKGKAEGNDDYRVVGGAASRSVQRLPAHCLNKTVTQRKWLPQIKCYPKSGRQSRGGRHQQDGETGTAGDDPRPLPSCIEAGEKPDPRRVHRGNWSSPQARHQVAGTVRR